MSQKKAYFDIRQVVDLTGISEYTLRGWENRYRAFRPHRTKTGRRLYDSADISRARALLDLTARGWRINKIAQLPTSKLQKMISENQSQETTVSDPLVDQKHHIDTLQSLRSLDWKKTEQLIRRTRQKYSPKEFLIDFLIPLMQDFRLDVEAGRVSIAQEHVLSALIKESLHVLRSEAKKPKHSELFLISTPEGDFHEIGALIGATFLAVCGYQTIYLGPHIPASHLCETVIQTKASHVLLAATASNKDKSNEVFYSFLNFLDVHLPPRTALWIGGPRTKDAPLRLRREFEILHSLNDLFQLLESKRGSR